MLNIQGTLKKKQTSQAVSPACIYPWIELNAVMMVLAKRRMPAILPRFL